MTRRKAATWVAVGGVVPIVASVALVPVRAEVDNATAALALAAVVLGVAVFGGRWPAAVAAVTAALAFDLFHTEPYGSFVIHGGGDVLKTALLLLLGLSAGTLVAHRTEAEAGLEERRTDLRRVREVTRFAERSPEALVERLELELVRLLDLDTATFERGTGGDPMPRITGLGILVPPGTPPLDRGRPASWAVELPVCAVDGQLGRFVLQPDHPSSGVDLPPGRRDLALTWADQLGFALSRQDRDGAPRG
jgi:hypothetical protein